MTSVQRKPSGSIAQDTQAAAHGIAVSLQDAARRCRWMAIDLGARDFALCLVGASTQGDQLTPLFDSNFPSGPQTTAHLLSGGLGEQLVRHARLSTAPCWWVDGDEDGFAMLTWTNRLASSETGSRGIAFPVYTDRGQVGIFVFGGAELAPDPASLHDLHGRCFALFDVVSRLGAAGDGNLPQMSRREIECLKLTSRGYTSEEIAKLLKLSVHTANQYLTQTTQKLNAVNRMHAVAKALRMGLID
ncbi:helix-turn-helix transcriptional regulator [Aminobacter sp. HY435]|uniref:helix-turn-helix transcriptional regulator n=1 Tax=Aminobacter sp. HY435 TaxID=2970917 RepID=UPI0022B9A5FB|nr:helix-turn-helix transcriptional regulator [Aminobacter sp. HY435]